MVVHSSIIHNSQKSRHNPSVHEPMNRRKCGMYSYNQILFCDRKKNVLMQTITGMAFENISNQGHIV
jgi:hypothetical protein